MSVRNRIRGGLWVWARRLDIGGVRDGIMVGVRDGVRVELGMGLWWSQG